MPTAIRAATNPISDTNSASLSKSTSQLGVTDSLSSDYNYRTRNYNSPQDRDASA
jgi:hypothetical protein